MERLGFRSIISIGVLVCLITALPQLFAQAGEGIELVHSYRFAEAASKLQEAVKNDPENMTARYYLAVALLHQEKYSEALQELKTIEKEQGKAVPSIYSVVSDVYHLDLAMAQAHLGLEQYEQAWLKLKSAHRENSNASDVYLYRGVYYYKQKDYEKAIPDLNKSLQLNSQNAYAYYYAGMVYSEMKLPDKMVEVFKVFLQLAPGAPEAPEVKRMVDAAC